MPAISSVTAERLSVKGRAVQVIALDTLFEEFHQGGWNPDDDGIEGELLEATRRAGNAIAPEDEDTWCQALADAYRDYCVEVSICTLGSVEDL
jgi:hypothetical protein